MNESLQLGTVDKEAKNVRIKFKILRLRLRMTPISFCEKTNRVILNEVKNLFGM